MGKSLKKVLSAVMIGIMAGSLFVGCGSKSDSSSSNSG